MRFAVRDQRRDGFAKTIKKAMEARLDTNADETLELLNQQGFGKTLAKHAIEIARQKGGLTVFAVVDALTRLSANLKNAGDRAEADERVGRLLALAT